MSQSQRPGKPRIASASETRERLASRPSRAPDFETENRALLALADAIAQAPAAVLMKLSEAAMQLCDAGSAGVSLFEEGEGGGRFVWAAVAGRWAPQVEGGMPHDASPCSVVLDENASVLIDDPQAHYPAAAGIEPKIFEILLTPIRAGGVPIGTVWLLSHSASRRFDAEDCRRLESLSRVASAAHARRTVAAELKRTKRSLDLTLGASAIVGLWEWRVDESIVYCDQRVAELFGMDPALAEQGAPIELFLDPIAAEDVARVRLEIEHAVATGDPYNSEYRVLSKQHGVRHVLSRGRCELGRNREPTVFRGTVVDISEQRVAEAERDTSRGRYEALFNRIDAGFCVVELIFDAAGRPQDYRFVEVNAAFERQSGLVDAVGKTVREMIPDLEQDWFDVYGEVATTGEPARFENHSKGLNDRWYEVHAFRAGDDTRSHVAVLFTDISQRRRVENELRSSEDSLRSLARATPNHVWTATADGQLNWFNERVYGYSGLCEGSLDGNAWTCIVHPDDLRPAAALWQACVDSGAPYETEFRLRRHDGAYRWHLARAVALRGTDGEIDRWVGTNTDIDDQKSAAVVLADVNAALESRVAERTASLLTAEESLRQSQKMEAVGQLTGGVAHDFNNLLTVIGTSIALLRRPTLPEDRRERMMEAISNAVARASKLTHQLLAFARRQVLHPEVFDAAKNVATMSEMLATLCGSRIHIETRIPDHCCYVNADASQFDTAIVNLAVNARDAIDGSGRISVAVAQTDAIPAIRQHPAVKGKFITVSVTDDGSGIAPHQLANIFEPFFTTKVVGEGTGLGLSQVFGFTKQSGGEIQVDSELGRGSTFTLYLVEAPAPEPVAAAEGAAPASPPNGGCILVVEDNAEVAASVEASLQELGYQVSVTTNAREALATLHEGAERFAAVFSDVVMAGMNGIELGHEIRRRHAGMPIVLSSGYSHVLAQNSAQGFALLPKPYSLEALAQVLASACAQRRA